MSSSDQMKRAASQEIKRHKASPADSHRNGSNLGHLIAALKSVQQVDIDSLTLSPDLEVVAPLFALVSQFYFKLGNYVASQVPPDVWAQIFGWAISGEGGDQPKLLLQLGRVCSQWNTISNKIFVGRFHRLKTYADNILFRFPDTTSLRLENHRISNWSLSQLDKVTSLTSLISLSQASSIKTYPLRVLHLEGHHYRDGLPFPYLTDLTLKRVSGITDMHLQNVPQLKYLDLTSNGDIKDLQELCQLQSLILQDNQSVHDFQLMQLKNLTMLNLDQNTLISDLSLLELKNLKNLVLRTNATISGTVLGQLPLLEALDIYCSWPDPHPSSFTNEHLAPCSRLVSLKIRGHDKITDIRSLTGLQNLVWHSKSCTDEQLSGLLHLTSLVIQGKESVTDESIQQLTNLLELSFMTNREITNDSIQQLEKLTSLEPNDQINWSSISKLTGLKKLAMTEEITEEELMCMTSLTDLKLSCSATPEAVFSLTNLRRLDLNDTEDICEYEIPEYIVEYQL